jgi:phosphatidylglycerol:prolipoprotein diacylglycerol transferase
LSAARKSCALAAVSATYVHNLDPVILRLGENIALRWYGLAYLAAFVIGVLLLNHLARRGRWVLPVGAAGDFVAGAAIFGVFLGGRLGYMLWYYPRAHGWSWVTEDPLMLVRVWDGGMASHGGILGLVIFTWIYARRKNVSWLGLGDALCVVAPLGLMLGRLANFINGELYGRVAEGLPWAMKFPGALLDPKLPESDNFDAAMTAAAKVEPGLAESFAAWNHGFGNFPGGLLFQKMRALQLENPEIGEAIAPFLEPRHPSPLYQAALEGALLFLILWFVWMKWARLPHGLLTGLFFIGYAGLRILGELFREPDSPLVGPFTSGQFLSLFMVAGGLAFIAAALRRGNTPGEKAAAAK